jgi:hypothetical protein
LRAYNSAEEPEEALNEVARHRFLSRPVHAAEDAARRSSGWTELRWLIDLV